MTHTRALSEQLPLWIRDERRLPRWCLPADAWVTTMNAFLSRGLRMRVVLGREQVAHGQATVGSPAVRHRAGRARRAGSHAPSTARSRTLQSASLRPPRRSCRRARATSGPCILGGRHLEHVLATFALHYNEHRPRRSLAQRPPLGKLRANDERSTANVIDLDRVRRRELLGGLIHEYRLAA